MAGDKIVISWDDLNSPHVDTRLKQQQAIQHAQQHYAQGGQQPTPTPRPTARGNVLYSAVVYMTLFGVGGGVAAWAVSERIWASKNQDFLSFLDKIIYLERSVARGEISEANAQSLANQWATEQSATNDLIKHFVDASDAEQTDLADQAIKRSHLETMLLYGGCGLFISLALSLAEPLIERNIRTAVTNGSLGICLGLIGGAIVGSFIDQLYQALGGGDDNLTAGQFIARSVGWGIIGLFIAIAPGFVMKNTKRFLIGLVGGALGGLIGGALFDAIGLAFGIVWLSRLTSLIAIGGLAGLFTGLIEAAVKTGWLQITAGVIAGKQFVLYKQTTYLGSSPQCEIYLFKDPRVGPRHAVIQKLTNGFELQDLESPTGTFVNGRAVSRVRLRRGDQIQIGATCLSFDEKTATAEPR